MKCAVSENATRQMQAILDAEEDKDLKFRVFIAHSHGDHVHYGLGLDYVKEADGVVVTESGLEILLEQGQKFLDGVEIDYNPEEDQWSVTHPDMGHTHH
ncbi:iron-sulfur cluster assembly accessory protein [Alicyclobacillaceae bacterium I2511]|nr:iron-sulfur cluster assembly accessory protein [Alicyclobacillaceae bacterium I2511]